MKLQRSGRFKTESEVKEITRLLRELALAIQRFHAYGEEADAEILTERLMSEAHAIAYVNQLIIHGLKAKRLENWLALYGLPAAPRFASRRENYHRFNENLD
jgi:hypothetical protein